MSFVHLHVHTNFSLGDGAGRIPELVEAARRLGMPALTVTDHDGLYGAVRFYQACKAAGIKPIVGVEISVESVLAPPPTTAEPAEAGPGTRANSERECYPRRQPRVPCSGSRSASPTPGPAAAGGAAATSAGATSLWPCPTLGAQRSHASLSGGDEVDRRQQARSEATQA